MKMAFFPFLILFTVLLLLSCKSNIGAETSKPNPNIAHPAPILPLPAKDNFNYTGSLTKGNYIWGGAMNLAWNELTDNIVYEKIKLVTNDPLALTTLDKLNNPVLTRQDMDDKSYYIKSGFGQKTVDIINRESRQKFPHKSFEDLNIRLKDSDIISYAYFLKEVQYAEPFEVSEMYFADKPVKGFKAVDASISNIYILDYQDDDHFLLGIKLRNKEDQIFLAKGYSMDNPDNIIADLRKKAPGNKDVNHTFGISMDHRDIFKAPMLSLNYNRVYKEMIGKVLQNKIMVRGNPIEYLIAVMFENIKFDMDEVGARVENEGVIVARVTSAGPGSTYKPRLLILDKPYWVMMKHFDSDNPYFILGVNNTEYMKALVRN